LIRRRALATGIHVGGGNHTFRETGITAYLSNGGTLEKARQGYKLYSISQSGRLSLNFKKPSCVM
jgi:hypothetical protein